MKRLPPKQARSGKSRIKAKLEKIEDHPETQALMRNLDKVYERLRTRARAEWLRSHAGEDPSDACVSVRIRCDTGDDFKIEEPPIFRDPNCDAARWP